MSKELADQKARDAVRLERDRNVVVDAGAGTGKTTLLVARVLELVAPEEDSKKSLSLTRMAAITFTRRAAGELKMRLRAAILRGLAQADLSETRRARLQAAREALDTAHIGTVHSFADRLLRVRPERAQVSPDYDICEDAEVLLG